MAKVLISDALSPQAEAIFKQRGLEVDVKTGLKPEELAAIIGEYDGLAIRSSTKVTADLLAMASKLKVVGRAGIGVDNVDIAAATARGVIVMNTPHGNAVTTAEHTIAMMMALARDIPAANSSTHAGKWEKNRFMGTELMGKTLGIIGCGNIGSLVAERAIGLKMRVIAFDPFLTHDRATALGIERVELDDLLPRADFITLHTTLTDSTRNLINAERMAQMKDGVRLINCARGGLVDEAALQSALGSGKVRGAALDVFVDEPAKAHPLFGNEKLICTPHLGASSAEAQENVALQVAEQIADYLTTGAISNALNTPAVSAEEAPRLKPYIALAEQLGLFMGQIAGSAISRLTISYEGHVASLNTKPLTATLLKGLLASMVEVVNMVNAPEIAKARGINVTEAKSQLAANYHTLITLEATTETGRHAITGTLMGGTSPRIVQVDGVEIEAETSANMLLVRNEDKPGFIGLLGQLLGDNQINIATFHLGRKQAGGQAIVLVSIDQALPAPLLSQLSALPHVIEAKALRFA